MARFGGESQFGRSQFGGNPWGVMPSYIVDEMIAALQPFHKENGGHVNTIAQLFGDINDARTIDLALKSEAPAWLINYRGGPMEWGGKRGSRFIHTQNFAILSISKDQRDRQSRIDSRNEYYPGAENMSAWAFREVIRRFHDNLATGPISPTNEEPFIYESARFVYLLELQCKIPRDAYDNDVEAPLLEQAGLVHTPKPEPAPLFEPDNVTPNSDDPTNNTPNVADLVEL
jgi:hypothetical protein